MAVERAERGIERRPAGRRRRRGGGVGSSAPGPESAAAVSPFRDCSCRVSRYPSMNLYTKHAVGPIAHTNIKRNSK